MSGKPLSSTQVAISKAFYALLIISGNVLIPGLICVAAYLKNSYWRSLLFMNFWFSWIGYSIGFLLLFYSGDWDKTPRQPSAALCDIQTIWVYVSPVWTASTTVALIFQLWLSVTSMGTPSTPLLTGNEKPKLWNERTRTLFLFWMPYFVCLVYAFAAFMVAQANPEEVTFIFLFCSVNKQGIRTAVSIFTASMLFFAILCQIDIGRRLYQQRLAVKQVRVQGWPVVSLFARMLLFIIVSGGAIAASVLAGKDNAFKDQRQVIQGALPLISFIVLGTNTGIYKRDVVVRESKS